MISYAMPGGKSRFSSRMVLCTDSATSRALLPGAWLTLNATARSRLLNALTP